MDNQIKHRIIDKILVSNDEKLLRAIDQIMDSASNEYANVVLSNEQKKMLEMSDLDIKSGNTISQKEMDKEDLRWLIGK